MKYRFLIISILFLTACHTNKAPEKNTVSEEISETILPKGKYVLEEEVKTNTLPTGTLNGIKNNPAAINNAVQPVDAIHKLQHRFKNLLVFHANDTMKINKSYLATLILGKDQVLEELKTEILETDGSPNDDIKQDTSFEMGTKMKARLIDMSGAGNKGFTIELIGGEEAVSQSITEKRKKVVWQWKLTPQAPGLQELKLSVNVIEKDGEIVNLPARNIPVVIYAEEEGFFSSVSSFLKNDNTKWLLSAILIPIFVAWYTTRMKNKTAQQNIKASKK
jgi:hypothetical protein